ncbi:hypothetical protein KY284_037656 [Solanum tuberosum]|nr:hypothetical protein KY284_037656 [Solanum tuberosum]
MHLQPNATGDSIMRLAMGKPFNTFRITLKQNERFIFQNAEKNDEVLINYCGMPLFFGRREFAIVSGLKCHPSSEPVLKFIVKKEPRRRKNGGKEEIRQSTEEQDLVSLVGIRYTKEAQGVIVLTWFVHNVLLAKDLNNNISLKWVNLSQDIEAFNNYPWGHESFELTVKYLLKPLGPKTNNLFGFPWAFMAWAFEAIPHLTYQVNVEAKISSPRILRWLTSKTKTAKNIPDLYNPPHYARGVKVIPSKNVRHPYTPRAKRRKNSFIKAIQNLKKKIFGELSMAVGEEVLEFKHVNVYKRVTIAEKNKLVDLTRAKELRAQYGMHYFSGEDFRTMASIDIWWEDWYVDEILSLMRERHVRYPEYYDSTDRILDLNFYSNFKVRYDKMSEEATTVGGRSFTQLINEFEWNEDMINYVRGIRPYLRGMDWIGAERLLAVMNLNKTHFVTLEILLHEGLMNVYDCLLMGMEHAKFLTFIQPVFELLPKLLKQSRIMKHLPDKFLNEPWIGTHGKK